MKKTSFLLFILSVFIFSGCKYVNSYTINGTIKQAEGVKVYLEDISDVNAVIIDTTTVKSGSFQIKNYSSDGIYRLRLGDDMAKSIFLYIQKKDEITITADLDKIEAYTVAGSKGSSSIKQLETDAKKHFVQMDSVVSKINRAPENQRDSIIKIFNQTKDTYITFLKDFIEKEPNNDVACFALNYFGDFKGDEITYIIDMVDRLHTSSPNSKMINLWYAETQKYQQEIEKQNEGGVALNTQAPNIILESPNGDTIQLKNLQGNYVLVDFWASWCGPCRNENPNVVKLYNQYHAKGFEIFSVSLDKNKDKWIEAIAKDKLSWKNHGSDLQGWNSAPAQVYQVQSIPATFLLDKTGKVIAKNLRGSQLEAKLAELFKEEALK